MRSILWAVLFISILLALPSALNRYRVEKENRTVEIAVDYDDFLEMCQREGLEAGVTLESFRQKGATSISLSEITLEKLHKMGKLIWIRGEDLPLYPVKLNKKVPLPCIIVFVKDSLLAGKLENAFSVLQGSSMVQKIPGGLIVQGKWDDLAQMGLGVSSEQVEALEKIGFLVDPRLENKGNVNFRRVAFLLHTIHPDPRTSTVIFTGLRNEVLGFDYAINQTADFLEQTGLRFGYIEAYDEGHVQKGSQYLASLIPTQVVKVQALAFPSLLRLDPEKGVETFSLGVNERNVRLIYFHPFLTSFRGMSVLETNLEFLDEMRKTLERGGFHLGKASTFGPVFPGRLSVLASVLGVTSLAFLLAFLFIDIPAFWIFAGLAGTAGGTLFLSFTHLEALWCSALGFLAALISPVLGIIIFSSAESVSFQKAVISLCKAVALTVAGGILVSALLANNLTMAGVEQFRGVKAILVLPVIIGPWLAWLFHLQKGGARDFAGAFQRLFKPLEQPARLFHLAAVLAFAGGGTIMILRSGNTAITGIVPGWERVFRVVLESTLVARPRFKEFLIGYPFFLMALMIGIKSGWGFFFLVAGSLGLADVMDSFAHLHTPLYYTFLRTFHALWIGVLACWFVWLFVRKCFQAKGKDIGHDKSS